jgi:short subunit dehydrogenase-like uncharacterized protein
MTCDVITLYRDDITCHHWTGRIGMAEPEMWIVGGTGRTGRGIAAALRSRGHAPVLVGRDAGRLAEAAAATGARDTVVAGTLDETAGLIERRRPTVVVNTVGPFTRSAAVLSRACSAGSDYVDLCNDVAGVSALLARSDAALAAGRTFVTGAGFGVTATESLVVRLCQERPAPSRVRVDMIPSLAVEAGRLGDALAATLVEGLPGVPGGGRYDSRRYEGGRLVRARLAGDPARLTLPDGEEIRTAGMPLGELVAAQRASGAGDVLSASSEAPTGTVGRAVLPLAARLLTISAVRGFARRRLAAIEAKARPAPREHSWAHARLDWPDGECREGWLRMGDASSFTAAVAAEVAHRLVTGPARPGASTPAALFGPALAETCGGDYLIDGPAPAVRTERT